MVRHKGPDLDIFIFDKKGTGEHFHDPPLNGNTSQESQGRMKVNTSVDVEGLPPGNDQTITVRAS